MTKRKTKKKSSLSSLLTILLAVFGLSSIWFYSCSSTTTTQDEQIEESELSQTLPSESPYIITEAVDTEEANPSSEGEIIRGDTTRMELPRLAGGNANYFISHRANGQLNYSLEYDVLKYHPRWVAFSFSDATAEDNVDRTDAWRWEPNLPARYSTEDLFRGSGYSRGHMVASEDRTFSQEANEQTFYYSNVSPQLQEHNAGIWLKLEKKVRQWGRNNSFRDTLYVAKGGTIRDDQIYSERVRNKIVIPKYYWMALLLLKDGQYHSIAFLTEHRKYDRKESNIRQLALSVDELERFTGLNFFYHLPKEVATQVESEDPNARVARQTWWR